MAMDKGKLAAFAKGADEAGDVDQVSAAPVEGAGEDFQEGGPGRFGGLIPLLEEHADLLGEALMMVDEARLRDTTSDLEPEDHAAVDEGWQLFPPELQSAFAEAFGEGGVTVEDAAQLADHLDAEGLVDVDAEILAGYLFLIAEKLESGELLLPEGEESEEIEDLKEGEGAEPSLEELELELAADPGVAASRAVE